jgi:hypothetical protein
VLLCAALFVATAFTLASYGYNLAAEQRLVETATGAGGRLILDGPSGWIRQLQPYLAWPKSARPEFLDLGRGGETATKAPRQSSITRPCSGAIRTTPKLYLG